MLITSSELWELMKMRGKSLFMRRRQSKTCRCRCWSSRPNFPPTPHHPKKQTIITNHYKLRKLSTVTMNHQEYNPQLYYTLAMFTSCYKPASPCLCVPPPQIVGKWSRKRPSNINCLSLFNWICIKMYLLLVPLIIMGLMWMNIISIEVRTSETALWDPLLHQQIPYALMLLFVAAVFTHKKQKQNYIFCS